MIGSRNLVVGDLTVVDSYSIILDAAKPFQVIYNEDTPEELKLIFDLTLVDEIKDARPTQMSPLGEAANFAIDVVKGRTGSMSEMRSFAKSEDAELFIFIKFSTSQSGVIDFKYTIYEKKLVHKKSKKSKVKHGQSK